MTGVVAFGPLLQPIVGPSLLLLAALGFQAALEAMQARASPRSTEAVPQGLVLSAPPGA